VDISHQLTQEPPPGWQGKVGGWGTPDSRITKWEVKVQERVGERRVGRERTEFDKKHQIVIQVLMYKNL